MKQLFLQEIFWKFEENICDFVCNLQHSCGIVLF
jgi:hypothetical protein